MKSIYKLMSVVFAFLLIGAVNTSAVSPDFDIARVEVNEKEVKFMENSRRSALWLAKTQKGWIKIDCEKGDRIDTRENIHQKIYEKVKKIIK